MAEVAQLNELACELGTADNEGDYCVRRSAASEEAFWSVVFGMLLRNGRGRCLVFMGAA